MNRKQISILIIEKLEIKKEELQHQFLNSKRTIGHFFIDDLLPEELVNNIHASFPELEETVLKKSLKENKYIAYQMNKYTPLLEEVIYAFQDKKVVELISEICAIENVFPDKNLYAGGLSLMKNDNFLNPHLDNSHDKDRSLWRVLNVLYYVTPNWKLENGGNLELWPNGLNQKHVTIVSKFNRLVVMATHHNSWHSVSKISVNDVRCCVSNYYFSKNPLSLDDKFHVTSFRGRPNEKIKNILFKLDAKLRMVILKVFKKVIRENPHQYKNK